jgi:hypothetical protein
MLQRSLQKSLGRTFRQFSGTAHEAEKETFFWIKATIGINQIIAFY